MIVKAKKDRELILIYAQNTQNENKAETIKIDVPEEYENFNKKIVFITKDGNVWDIIQNNEYKITNAITKYKQVDFYIWLTKDDVDFRSKTKTLKFYDNIDASDEITPEEIHGVNTVINILEEEIDKVENIDITAERVSDGVEISITDKEGETTTTKVNDGTNGQDGYTPQKGVDYFTEQDITEIETEVKNDIQENVLVNYSLKTETGSILDLSINSSTYVMTIKLKNSTGTVLSTGTVDLPLESVVVSGTYDSTNKKIILTLQNGNTIDIPVGDLISGLQAEITSQNKLASDLVDDTNQTNKFVTSSEKETWNSKIGTNDYAEENKNGILKTSTFYNFALNSDGRPNTPSKTYSDYQSMSVNSFIGKGTLENVITGKQLVNQTTLDNSQAVQDTEISYLESVTEQLPKVSANGTEITLDTIEAKMSVGIKGNTEQNQYTGKNLFNKNAEGRSSVTTKTVLDTGVRITITDGGNSRYYAMPLGMSELLGNKVTISSDIVVSGSNTAQAYLFFGASTSTAIQYIGGIAGTSSGSKKATVTIPSSFPTNCDRIWLLLYASAGEGTTGDYVDYNNLQAEIGTTQTSYEPYVGGKASPSPDYPQNIRVVTGNNTILISNSDNTESQTYTINLGNITLCGLGDYRDYFYKDEDKWYLYKTVDKKIYNGSTSDGWFKYSTNTFASGRISTARKSLCDYYEFKEEKLTATSLLNGEYCYASSTNNYTVLIKDTNYDDVNGFKTWLSTHNITIYYVLETPTTTEITDTTLIGQLNTIKEVMSYAGQTNITSTHETGNAPLFINAEAFSNIEKELNNIENELEEKVDDVQVNGTSIVNNGVANIPMGTTQSLGVVKAKTDAGTTINQSGELIINPASDQQIKEGTGNRRPITPDKENASVFYGLAKASGDTTQASSTNPVGTYTDTAKQKIREMLGAESNEWEKLVDKTLQADSSTALAYTDYAYEGKFKKIRIQIRGTVDTNNANISFYRANSSSAYQVFGNVCKNADTLYEFELEGKPYLQTTAIRDSSVELKVYNVASNTWTMLYQGRAPVASTMDNITDLKITSNANFQTGTRVVVWGLK